MTRKNTKWISRLILVIAIAVFLYSTVQLGMIFWEYHKGRQEYAKLERFTVFSSEGTSDTVTPEESRVDFAGLKEVNSDTVGWIRFENLDINYPIVQGKDNEYYLSHGFRKEPLKSGSIFMEVENSPDFGDNNTFLYGHNMKDNSMFARLNSFKKEEVYRENPEFLIETENGSYRYAIYACYTAEVGSDSFAYHFGSEEQYAQWQKTVKERSFYDTGVVPESNQKTVTLMTCTPKGENYRFLVHGVLTEAEQTDP